MQCTIRTTLRPGDIGEVVALHGRLYQEEYGFDERFEAYVAKYLADFALKRSPRERIWIAERDGRIVGVIAIVEADERTAQLRWYLVAPEARGRALGKQLMREAIEFARGAKYDLIVLWTVNLLRDAARIYDAEGFELMESKPGAPWGVTLVEQCFALKLTPASSV